MNKYIFYSLIHIAITLGVNRLEGENFVSFNVTTLDNPSPGYIFTGPVNEGYAVLYDNSGKAVYSKDLSNYGKDFTALRLLDNGSFACYCYSNNKWFILDENLHIIDIIGAKSSTTNFHTLFLSPEGNYLLVGDNNIQVNMSEKVSGGKTNARIINHKIQEIDRNQNLIFEWNCYEKIDVTMATEDIELTSVEIDPYHINCARYDNDGNIIANFRNLDAVIKIDRSNGSIIWWWGGSKSKRNDFTFINDTENGFTGFSHQHDPKRLDNGNILLFDNGNLKPSPFSRAVEYSLDENNKTATKVWEYRRIPGIFAEFMGNAQRLSTGNTLIGWGVNNDINYELVCTEVTSSGYRVFEMKKPGYRGYYQVLRNNFKMDAVSLMINSAGSYNFNAGLEQTGVKLDISALNGSGNVSIEKHYYLPHNISFSSSEACTYLPFRWVISNKGFNSFSGRIYFDISKLGSIYNKNDLKIFWRLKENSGSFTMLETVYNQMFNRIEASIQGFGEFILAYMYLYPSTLIYPSNDTNYIRIDPTLKWTKNSAGEKSRIQLSRDFNFYSIDKDTIVEREQTLKLNDLINFTRYYWRVKLIDGSCQSNWQQPYSFVTIIGEPVLIWPNNGSKDRELTGDLIWSKVLGAENYKIQLSETNTFSKLIVNDILDTSNYFFYKGLKPLTKYYWRVSAANGGYFGQWSNVFEFKTSAGKPEPVEPGKDLTGVYVNGTLKWNTINSVNVYKVQLSYSSDFSTKIFDTNVTATSLSYSGLRHATDYYWRVSGLFNDTVTNWSEIWKFRTLPNTPVLNYPRDSATNVSHLSNINWWNVNSAIEYQIQIADNEKFDNIIYDKKVKTTYYQYYLKFSKRYYWRVRANDGFSFSDWSNIRTFVTNSQLFYPKNNDFKIPVNVRFDWFQSAFVDGYDLRLAKDSLYLSGYQLHLQIPFSNHIVNELEYNTKYYWSIRDYKDSTPGVWTETYCFTTELQKPEFINPVIDMIMSDNIRIEWKAIAEAEYYLLQISIDSTFSNNIINKDDVTDLYFDFDGILYDTTYFCRIKCYNSINASGWSNILSFKKITPKPLISPNGGEIWLKGGKANLILWDSSLMSNVRIELLRFGIEYSIIKDSLESQSGSYEWNISTDIENDSLYKVRITNLENPHIVAISKNFFTITDATDIEYIDYTINNLFLAQPNPFIDELEINCKCSPGIYTVFIFDIFGRQLNSFKNLHQNGNFNLIWNGTNSNNEHLPTGIYYLRLNSNENNLRTLPVLLKR